MGVYGAKALEPVLYPLGIGQLGFLQRDISFKFSHGRGFFNTCPLNRRFQLDQGLSLFDQLTALHNNLADNTFGRRAELNHHVRLDDALVFNIGSQGWGDRQEQQAGSSCDGSHPVSPIYSKWPLKARVRLSCRSCFSRFLRAL